MKAMLLTLIILSYFGIANSIAQQTSNNEDIEASVFGLIKLKHNYEELLSRKRTNSVEERKILAASALDKSEYGSSVKAIKSNAAKYRAYIEKTISTNAEALSKQTVNYQHVPLWDSGMPDRNVISKLDYLKAVKYSLFEQKSAELLPLYQIPGIKLKYAIPKSSAIRPTKQP